MASAAREYDLKGEGPSTYQASYSRLIGYVVQNKSGEVECAESTINRSRSPKHCEQNMAEAVETQSGGARATQTAALPAMIVTGAVMCYGSGVIFKKAIVNNSGAFSKFVSGLKFTAGSMSFLSAGLTIVETYAPAAWTNTAIGMAGALSGASVVAVALCSATSVAGYKLNDKIVTYMYSLRPNLELQPMHK